MSDSNAVKVTLFDDGPIKIEGAFTLVDENDKPIEGDIADGIFLCRCGASNDKPYCDGSHHDCEFRHKVSS